MSYTLYLVSTSDFNRPKEIRGAKATAYYLLQLLLLEPGTNPLKPEMGIGFVSKYRFSNLDKNQLDNELREQVSTYLPDIHYEGIDIKIDKENIAHIQLRANDTVYDFNQSLFSENKSEYVKIS